MSVYVPPFVPQLDGTRCAGSNCSPTAHSIAAMRHRQGSDPAGSAPWPPTPKYIRNQVTPTSCDSVNLVPKIATVLIDKYGITLLQKGLHAFSDAVTLIRSGRGMTFAGGYGAVLGTRHAASATFKGNHRFFVNQRAWLKAGTILVRYGNGAVVRAASDGRFFRVADPLANGRKLANGKYAPKGYQWWTPSFLKKVAGACAVSSGPIGAGYIYGNYT